MRCNRRFRRGSPLRWLAGRSFILLWAFAVAAGSVDLSHAVLIQTVTGTDNTTAPADDPGFANVGYSTNGLGTAIYLGDGWVLTAGHVGGGGIVLSSGTYLQASGSGSGITLVNTTPGKSTYTDLYMYRLATSPAGLPTLSIASTMPDVGAEVTMIGGGLNRGAYTEWLVNTSTTPWVWTATGSTGGVIGGYVTLGSRAIRWGTNNIEERDFWVKSYWGAGPNDYNEVKSVDTVFDEAAGSTEAQAVLRDSGGAVFTKIGGQWQLAGVIYSVYSPYSGQPNPVYNAVFGDYTLIADLSYYRPQIVAAIPEPTGVALAAAGLTVLLAGRGATRRRTSRQTAPAA